MKSSQLAKWLQKADDYALVLPLRTEYHVGLGIGNVYDGDGEIVASFDNVRHAQLVVTLLNAIYGEAKPEVPNEQSAGDVSVVRDAAKEVHVQES